MTSARKKAEQLRIECSDRDAEEIMAEAIDRVPGFFTPTGEIPAADRRLPVGLASLAIGDRDFTLALMDKLAGEDFLILAARYCLWSGALHVIRQQLPRIDETASRCLPFAELHELAIALESAGAAAESAAVRQRAAQATRRYLPDWENEDCNILPAGNPADTVNVFMHTLLGIAPDAPRKRLRLRPCLPDWMDKLRIHNLHLGDATITLHFQRTPSEVRYSIEQVAGAMPVRLVFEPVFTHPLNTVFVDDVAADLQMQVSGSRVVAPLQVMLDHERVLRFQRA